MISRSKSFLVWILGFLFTFIFGTSTGRTERPQMKYGIKPPPDLIKPLQPVKPILVQPMYGIRPRPDFDLNVPIQKPDEKLINKRIDKQIDNYIRPRSPKKYRETNFLKLRKAGKAAIVRVDIKLKKMEKRNARFWEIIRKMEADGRRGGKLTKMKQSMAKKERKCTILRELKERLVDFNEKK